ncbi:MAG TPA: UbiD family decarboxylase [Verrucomicrobiae bacterium]|nr:UbiD family decarboxylase [Verrucomicrobiae bacterium]
MPYRSLKECVLDLEKQGHLVRLREEVDPDLEMAEIHRRVFRAGGPAILYEKVKGSPFPAVSNLFGTWARAQYLFHDTLKDVKKMVGLKADPSRALKNPGDLAGAARAALHALPRKISSGPVLENVTHLDQLPQVRCWPKDGGSFVLLGQVYTEHPARPGIMKSNMGMYRVQMSGNEYRKNYEAGLHYQIRRDIGIHHHAALERGEPLRVSVFVGGPPAHAFAAVMYLPEGLPEAAFAGALAGRGFRYGYKNGYGISMDADFCITGTVNPGVTKPEGPFGDHLGYYSLKHEFPVLNVDAVYHRKDAIWPFTVVGRPPQEDSIFGKLVHEVAGPMIPVEIPGVTSVHAVDASGVHPLLLAVGKERYVPYAAREPQELLTHANALLGYGPCSLAKFLMIAAAEDDPQLDAKDIEKFLRHVLERIDWARDLHFQTRTTIDTLDYSGTGLNRGSKVVMAAAGPKKRNLGGNIPRNMPSMIGFEKPRFVLPGVMAVKAPPFRDYVSSNVEVQLFAKALEQAEGLEEVPLIVLADDSDFMAANLENFLWAAFTRSNPSHDIHGVGSFTEFKHWGCRGPLILDARLKPHHAPPLEEDPKITEKVNRLGVQGGPLHGII